MQFSRIIALVSLWDVYVITYCGYQEYRNLHVHAVVYSCCGNDHFPPIVPFSPPPYIGKLYVIVEFCSKGNLLMFLRSKRNDHQSPLTVRSSVDMAAQVATGMEFLASKKVHKYSYLSYCILYTLH